MGQNKPPGWPFPMFSGCAYEAQKLLICRGWNGAEEVFSKMEKEAIVLLANSAIFPALSETQCKERDMGRCPMATPEYPLGRKHCANLTSSKELPQTGKRYLQYI